MARKGNVADRGLSGVIGRGVIMCAPVSVCHHVSMIGSSAPVTSRYQIHASGLIGSPTDPSSLREERSYFSGHCCPKRIRARIAVGVVYQTLTPYFWMMRHHLPVFGTSNDPSYKML